MLANFFKKNIQQPLKSAISAILGILTNNTAVFMGNEPRTLIKEGYESSADLYAIVSYIAQKCKELEIVLYQKTKDGIVEVAEHEAIDVWHKKDFFGLYTYKERIEILVTDLLITGTCYILKDKGQTKTKVLQILPIPSSEIDVVFGNEKEPILKYQVRNLYYDRYFTKDEIIAIKMPNLGTEIGRKLYGFSPAIAAKKVIMQLNDADITQTAMLQNGGTQGFIVPDTSAIDWTEITQETLEKIKKAYQENYAGVYNRGKIAVANIPLKFIDTSKTTADLSLAEMQLINLRRLASVYKFPTALINDNEHSTYNNIRETYKKLYIDCVIPTFNRILDRVNAEFLNEFGLDNSYYFAVDTDKIEVLQQDKLEQVKWMKEAECFTTNEIRESLGWGRVEAEVFADEILVSTSRKFLRDLLNE